MSINVVIMCGVFGAIIAALFMVRAFLHRAAQATAPATASLEQGAS